jgi:hypothetical protein
MMIKFKAYAFAILSLFILPALKSWCVSRLMRSVLNGESGRLITFGVCLWLSNWEALKEI